jgi:hypothetical protein
MLKLQEEDFLCYKVVVVVVVVMMMTCHMTFNPNS